MYTQKDGSMADKQLALILLRHGEHMEQVLLPESVADLEMLGAFFSDARYSFSTVISSPQPRCTRTIEAVLRGMNLNMEIATDDRLGDLKMDPAFSPDLVARIKTLASQAGKEPEEYILSMPELASEMARRGEEGKAAVMEAYARFGGTVLVCSHGGSRLEVTLEAILGHEVPGEAKKHTVTRSSITKVYFDDRGTPYPAYEGNFGRYLRTAEF